MNIDSTPHLTRLKQALAATQNDLQTIALRRVEASGIIAEVTAIEADRRTVTDQRDKMVDALAQAVSGPCCLDAHMENRRTIEALQAELDQCLADKLRLIKERDAHDEASHVRSEADRRTIKELDIRTHRSERAAEDAIARAKKAERELGEVGVQLAACRVRLAKAEAVIAPTRRFARSIIEVIDPVAFPSAMEMHFTSPT